MPHFEDMINDEEKNLILGGTLYLVATPIGNLSDLSARAIKYRKNSRATLCCFFTVWRGRIFLLRLRPFGRIARYRDVLRVL